MPSGPVAEPLSKFFSAPNCVAMSFLRHVEFPLHWAVFVLLFEELPKHAHKKQRSDTATTCKLACLLGPTRYRNDADNPDPEYQDNDGQLESPMERLRFHPIRRSIIVVSQHSPPAVPHSCSAYAPIVALPVTLSVAASALVGIGDSTSPSPADNTAESSAGVCGAVAEPHERFGGLPARRGESPDPSGDAPGASGDVPGPSGEPPEQLGKAPE